MSLFITSDQQFLRPEMCILESLSTVSSIQVSCCLPCLCGCRRGYGQWSSDGVTTLYVNGSQQVLCNSTHLTSFAVLVDVSGHHTVSVIIVVQCMLWTIAQEINPVEARALSIVSYIGCTVSIICLTLTVIFFLSFGSVLAHLLLLSLCCVSLCVYRKKLFVSVHNFVHLNLSAALLAGLIVFVAGIETAINDRVSVCLYFSSSISWSGL